MNDTMVSLLNMPANTPPNGQARNKQGNALPAGQSGNKQTAAPATGQVWGKQAAAPQSAQAGDKPAVNERPARTFAQVADEANAKRKTGGRPDQQDGKSTDSPEELALMAALPQWQVQARIQTAQDEDATTSHAYLTAMDASEARTVSTEPAVGSADKEVKGEPLSIHEFSHNTNFAKLRQELIKPDKGGNLTDKGPNDFVAAPDALPAVSDTLPAEPGDAAAPAMEPGRDIMESLRQTVTGTDSEPAGKEIASSFMDMRARLAALSHEVSREALSRDAVRESPPPEPDAPAALHMAAVPAGERESADDSGTSSQDDRTAGERPAETRRAVTNARENQKGLFALAQPAGPEHLTGAAPRETAVTPSQIIRQIVETTAFSQTGNISQIKLQLNPEFLGRVNIVLSSTAGEVSARIQTQSGAVRDMLAANLFKLETELRNLGINMKSIDITHAGLTGGLAGGQGDGRSFRRNHDSDGPSGTRPVTMARFHQMVRTPMAPAYDDGFGETFAPREENGVDFWA